MRYFFGLLVFVGLVALVAVKTTFFGWLLALLVGVAAFLATAFVLWSFGFWAVLVIGSCLIIYSIDEGEKSERDYRYKERMNEGGIAAAFTIVAALLLFQFFGDIKIFSYLYHHPLYALGWLSLYVFCGAVWSLAKWTLFALDRRDWYRSSRQEFLKEKNAPGNFVPEELKVEWRKRREELPKKPDHRDYMYAITKWMAYWPWSMLWELFDNLVRKMWRRIYEALESLYQKISDSIWRDVEKDFS